MGRRTPSPDNRTCTIRAAGSNGRCNTICLKLFSSKVVFSGLWEIFSAYSYQRADLMRCFESQPLVREIGCTLGKAHDVFHLKRGVALTH